MGQFNQALFSKNIEKAKLGTDPTHVHVKSGRDYWVIDLEIDATHDDVNIRYMDEEGKCFSRSIDDFFINDRFKPRVVGWSKDDEFWTKHLKQVWCLKHNGRVIKTHSTKEACYIEALEQKLVVVLHADFAGDKTQCLLTDKAEIVQRWEKVIE